MKKKAMRGTTRTQCNFKTEHEYRIKNVDATTYQALCELPDSAARSNAVMAALDPLAREPNPDENGPLMREIGKRRLFALAQIQIDELERLEAKSGGAKWLVYVVQPAEKATEKARESSYLSATGKPPRAWSLRRKAPGFFKARTNVAFQSFLTRVGLRNGKVSPELRKAAKSSLMAAERQGMYFLDAEIEVFNQRQ